jgi:predicted NAD/FAD-dependent oxidoreductase
MATLTPISGSIVQLGAAETTIYTATAQTLSVTLRLSNITAAAKTVELHVVPSGGSASDTNAHLKTYSIPANDYADIVIGNIASGTVISGLASAGTSVNAAILTGIQRIA